MGTGGYWKLESVLTVVLVGTELETLILAEILAVIRVVEEAVETEAVEEDEISGSVHPRVN